ncbi:MAG TPA: flagellar export protein FliJ [Desulfobulbus sp.]|nr:flagellar export protein FliJ [Desulfobulbus sp.]
MKPFSMEPVLRYRKQLEDEARQKLFISRKKEAEISRQLKDVQQVITDLYADLENEKKEGTTVDRLLLYENRILLEQERLLGLQEKLVRRQKEVARRRRRLLHASQEKKGLEKLKEKQNLAYKQFRERQEAAMLDEIAVLRHGRR